MMGLWLHLCLLVCVSHEIDMRLCDKTTARLRRTKMLVEGETNILDSADACAAACKQNKACNAWFWCDDAGGCETEQRLPLPLNACQLQKQAIRFPFEPPTAWKASHFVAGYDGGVLRFCDHR